MKIAFYLDSADPEFLRMADIAIAAARKNVPGAIIVHLTTEAGPKIAADEEIRVKASSHYTRSRAVAQSEIEGDALIMDVDMLIRADVSPVWQLDFDIAIPEVADPYVRYTGGLMFCRCPEFWREWSKSSAWDGPFNSRKWLQAFGEFVDRWPGKVLRLQESVYEALPVKGEAPHGAMIVHYRGPRKKWMLES